jgi:2-methylisocitrate lyase-like PEP mutase family enzyme
MTQTAQAKAKAFAALHVPGDHLILFNVWDAGSAQAVAKAGAKAIASGSASVAGAYGVEDGEDVPMEAALAIATRIVASVDLPVTIDFEGGYAVEPEETARNLARLAATGAIGCNFEDQVVGGAGMHDIDVQSRRIAAIRAAVGSDFFINARTDFFLQTKPEAHDGALADAAIERAKAYADAGASGFFIPGLTDLALVERITKTSPLPINAMTWAGAPSKAEWAGAGIARISYGPGPFRQMQQWLEETARAELV